MRDLILQIRDHYSDAKKLPLEKHALAQMIRRDLPQRAEELLPNSWKQLHIDASSGNGNWAEIVWMAFFDPSVTLSATKGFYVVYLFSSDQKRLVLSLNQGVTDVEEEFGRLFRSELKRRASLLRDRVPNFRSSFTDDPIDLSAKGRLGKSYQAGHAFGVSYDLTNVPTQESLQKDLLAMLSMYVSARTAGGITDLIAPDEFDIEDNYTLQEKRMYTLHRRIERDPSTSRAVKKALGTTCQGCDFDFEAVYGDVGRNYIEAHHLIPLSQLPEEKVIFVDVKTGFAVLCANCHRMMHRRNGPRTIDELRACKDVQQLAVFFKKVKQK